jgi:(E)-4-hydroxy-3-methylbut-2-enyl-diphosphate synthase
LYRRRPARVVRIGDVPVGGSHPIAVQSMTTPATTDTAATVAQIASLVEAGCAIVRVTVPTTRDADNLPAIRAELARRRIRVPLVADIHFTPAAAMKAVEHVEKVRVNPGNYADKKRFAVREYSDVQYAAELERLAAVFSPLVLRCKALGVAMRIGTNHGSLSDRIMNRYGDSPQGMVESALEFVRICRGHGYHDLVLSMKSSNPVVVIQAYRLLARRMDEEGMDYPFHLGVTEAGDGEDGRIKSAVGIGALLDEGMGDTVRVSLTEDPVAEIPVARALVAPYDARRAASASQGSWEIDAQGIHAYARRPSRAVHVGPHVLGDGHAVLVEVPLDAPLSDLDAVRRAVDAEAGVRVPEETRAEIVGVRATTLPEVEASARLRASLELVAPRVALSLQVPLDLALAAELLGAGHRLHVPLWAPLQEPARVALAGLMEAVSASGRALLLEVGAEGGAIDDAVALALETVERAHQTGGIALALALDPTLDHSPRAGGLVLARALRDARLDVPLVLIDRPLERGADPLLGPSAALGGLLCDGIGDAVRIEAGDAGSSRRTGFNLLQAARVRITKTDFISCPSCGRTLFDLEATTARIKARTAHLKGLKIAIMGCVVNGPGEMADADFGYVGWGESKIALFVGKDIVARDVPVAEADERLVQLIKEHGRWVEPVSPSEASPPARR